MDEPLGPVFSPVFGARTTPGTPPTGEIVTEAGTLAIMTEDVSPLTTEA